MKLHLLFATLLLCCIVHAQDPAYPAAPPAPQNLVRAEYFVDTDPGFGNGVAITITPATTIAGLVASINTAGLSNGVHRLFVRTRGNEGAWSLSAVADFVVDFDRPYPVVVAPQNLVQAEYFIDTDPGVGNGTPIALTPAVDISSLSVSINTTGLSNGVHRLYLRSRNNEGRWSITASRDFVVDFDPSYATIPPAPQNITQAEYFINTDPGAGNGIPINLTPGVDINNLAVSINTSSLPPASTNRLYIRTRNNEGRWSITAFRTFIVDIVSDPVYPAAPPPPQNIVQAEYFINTDPGYGNGTPITITPGVDLSNVAVNINTTGLPPASTNNLFIRSRNNEGRWSLIAVRTFVVDIVSDPPYPTAPATAQNIVQAEYFVNTDPGIGSGIPIALTPATDIANLAFTVNTSALPASSINRLYVRSRSTEGKWSLTPSAQFNVGTLTILPDSLSFLVTAVGDTSVRSLVVRNNSTSQQTITGVAVGAPFGSDFTTTRTINALSTDTIRIRFTPTAPGNFRDTVRLQTSAGPYQTPVVASAVSAIRSWAIDPATGRDYGNVTVGSSSGFNFTIRNTGTVPATLDAVITSNPAFVPSFTSGTVIPVNGSINLPVSFNPTVAGPVNAQLKIRSVVGGPDSVTTTLSGNGFVAATPPVLTFLSTAPYSGLRGVNPSSGQPGVYTYKVLYRSAVNNAPATGYPQVGIDLNGDGDFTDAGEGMYAMAKETAGNDYITGVVYSYAVTFSSESNTLGYRFFATDSLGNTAASINTAYNAGPVVSLQVLDLRLFANDISFSKTNPLPGDVFTVTANITNSTAVAATNVPVSFYRDTILIGSTTIPTVAPFGTATVTRTLSFAADGFYPIKVWVDSARTLVESNILNNYAIRPVIVGSPSLPGGITVTANAVVQACPGLRLVYSGSAQYFGTGTQTSVAGAAVTINTGTAILTTTTDASGNFTLVVNNPPCGNTTTYTVSVTDFTFTSNTFTGSVTVTCPAPNACGPQPPPFVPGFATVTVANAGTPCALVQGGTAQTSVKIRYRGRNLSNFWNGWDRIWKDTVKIFNNGVLIQTYSTPDIPEFGSAATFPGDEKTYPVTVPLNTAGVNNITAVATYQYNEFFQIPSSLYKGVFTNETATAGNTVIARPNAPDLTISNFAQTGYRSIRFDDANIECGAAGSHLVEVINVTGGSTTLFSTTVSGVPGVSAVPVTVSLSSLAPGTYVLRIRTDVNGDVTEVNETNNSVDVTVVIPLPDLITERIVPGNSNVPAGGSVSFNATIRNTGIGAGAFQVRFDSAGTGIGSNVAVAGLGENSSTNVSSALLQISTPENSCPIPITVTADAAGQISESDEVNNIRTIQFGADVTPVQLAGEFGTTGNPVRVRVNTSQQFNAYIRNLGTRDAVNVTVRFRYAGSTIGTAVIPRLRAGVQFPAVATFTYAFPTPGNAVVTVEVDTANAVCEIDEANNSTAYNVVVSDSGPDYQVLSQFISPSSLNPNTGQNITIVGTVRNIGNKVTPPSSMRFYVDGIPLGAPVPFDSLRIGRDTTLAATATYSSLISGLKTIRITVNEQNTVSEEDSTNNSATRIIIVGAAPDMTKAVAQPISFNPNGFRVGDSVVVAYQVTNAGSNGGTAWARFKIFDFNGSLIGLDSVQFTLAPGANATLTRKMLFSVTLGTMVVEIANCTPDESNVLNNVDSLFFTTVFTMRSNLTVNNLNMKEGAPAQLPGWIGGKLLLGNFDLTVNGNIINYDTAHFIVTNGTGKLRIVNSNAQNIFPVGPLEFNSNFAIIDNSGTPDNFSVRVMPQVFQTGNSGALITTGFVNRTWFITEDVPGGSNARVQLNWFSPDEQPGFARTASRIAHYTSSWGLGTVGVALADSIGRWSRFETGYNNFSPFSVNGGNFALPLRFLLFAAQNNETNVGLKWRTAEEVGTSHFEIERSADARTWAAIGRMDSRNSGRTEDYNFTDAAPLNGISYYRLKQVDVDGKFSYSIVVAVNWTRQIFVVYPNPVQDVLNIVVKPSSASKRVELRDAGGRLVYVATLAPNSNYYRLPMISFAAGMYIVQVWEGNESLQKTILKE
jgi:subtilase family serine protease